MDSADGVYPDDGNGIPRFEVGSVGGGIGADSSHQAEIDGLPFEVPGDLAREHDPLGGFFRAEAGEGWGDDGVSGLFGGKPHSPGMALVAFVLAGVSVEASAFVRGLPGGGGLFAFATLFCHDRNPFRGLR